MKIKNLKNYGIPPRVLDIWEENCSPFLLPVQEEAVRNYGILDCDEGNTRLPRRFAPRNDKKGAPRNDSNNLLVIAPPSQGKSFLGEMVTIAHLTHQKKCIYLSPFRFYAEEKYSYFKNLYSACGLGTIISTRNRQEDDCRIIQGDYELAVMDYEKFNYFLLMYPKFLTDVSLVIIDEMQIIDDPKWGPLLEEIIDCLLKKDLVNLRIIALSALVENQDALLKWFPAHPLTSYPQPVEIRKGVVREGVFKYTTSNEEAACRREIFFKPEAVRDNCFEDYLLETVKYFIKKDEPTLIFFATPAETRKWAGWLASRLESPAASSAIKELHQMEDTLSRKELLEVLEKGVAYHNPELFWEEKNLVETHLKKGEIKIVCASTKYSMGINLPFKNIIIPSSKIHNHDGNYLNNYRTSLGFTDIENMGRRAGNENFGRIIFLAYSLLAETIHKNTYSNFTGNTRHKHKTAIKQLVKEEKELLTFILRLSVKHKLKPNEIKKYLKEGATHLSGYWHFSFDKENIEKKIDRYLNILKGKKLIREIKGGILSPTANGILITALKIKVETYLFFKNWMKYSRKGEISELEIILLLAFSADGRALPIPFSQLYKDDDRKEDYNRGCRGNCWNKLLRLVIKHGDEDKKLYQDKIMLKKIKEDSIPLEDYLAFKKTCLLYNWIKGDKDNETIEQENGLYGRVVQILGEGFSWLADNLVEIAKNEGWRKDREEDLNKIKILSRKLIDGVEEDGLNLSQLHILGLRQCYIGKLLKEGYKDENYLKELSEEQLSKVLPKGLVNRVQKRFAPVLSSSFTKNDKPKTRNPKPETCNLSLETRSSYPVSSCSPPKTENCIAQLAPCSLLQPILEIDQHRPDRIIFEGKEVKVTTIGFSLLYLLAQHNGKVVGYEEILKDLWKGETDAIYTRINHHICKIRKDISKIMDKKEDNTKKIENIFKAIPGRGLMLNIKEEELEIN